MRETFKISGISAMIIAILLSNLSCTKLDVKPKLSQVVPTTYQDLQGLMDNDSELGTNQNFLPEVSAGDFLMPYTNYLSGSATSRRAYIWDKELFKESSVEGDWNVPYRKVFYANLALDGLNGLSPNSIEQADYNNIKGQALFHRSFAFYLLSQEFMKPFDPVRAGSELGIPLRMTSNLNDPTRRSTMAETYDRMLTDLKEAAELLPAMPLYKTRPSRCAAYGLLARISLATGDFEQAKVFADKALQLYGTLVDYNTVSGTPAFPFTRLNSEVVFHSTLTNTGFIGTNSYVDDQLYQSYGANDLRKTLFFKANTNGTYTFRGSYNGSIINFGGIAVDELYLTRAEAYARTGNLPAAVSDLNTLLSKRFKTGLFMPAAPANTDAALTIILAERRKELLGRGIRWADLRRLNLNLGTQITLTKTLNGATYTLPPNDPRYTFPIPDYILRLSGIEQNP